MSDRTAFTIEIYVGRSQTEATIYGPGPGPYIWKEYGDTMSEAVEKVMDGFKSWAIQQAMEQMSGNRESDGDSQ